MELTENEKRVLHAMDQNIAGGAEPKKYLLDALHPVFDDLVRKGLVEQIWQLSEAGEKAIHDGAHRD